MTAIADRQVELWLVRHGETEWAASGRHTSRTDVDLTAGGRAQAKALASELASIGFGLVLSSPRRRALDTARLAGFAERVTVDPDLSEWDYGRYEGLTTEEIRRRVPGWTIWHGEAPGGETGDQVSARADRVIARVAGAGVERAIVFSHGHMLRVLAARWLGLPAADGGWFALDVASISVLGWEHGARVVVRWNVEAAVRAIVAASARVSVAAEAAATEAPSRGS